MIEIDIEEVVKAVESQWISLAIFFSMCRFSVRGLFEDMARAWSLCHGMDYKILKGNMFLIEF